MLLSELFMRQSRNHFWNEFSFSACFIKQVSVALNSFKATYDRNLALLKDPWIVFGPMAENYAADEFKHIYARKLNPNNTISKKFFGLLKAWINFV